MARQVGPAPALALALLALALPALAACTGVESLPPPFLEGAGNPTPVRGGTLRICVNDDIRNLDPAIAYDEFSSYGEHLLYDTLLDYAPAGAPDPTQLEPKLAESWSVSTDGLVYSFTLRAGIRYATGDPIVAADFVTALERVLDPDTGSPGASFYGGIVGASAYLAGEAEHVAGLQAHDDRRLEIRLDKPDASFPLVLAMKFAVPLQQAWIDARGDRMRDTPLASGPFQLAEWKQGELLRFVRNPYYWDPERPYLDEILLYVQVSRDVAILKFLKGEIDTVDRLSSDQYIRFKQSAAWAPYMQTIDNMNVYGELMDVTKPPFDDRRVRQAMNYAVNKDDTVKLYNGRAIVSHGLLPPNMPGYDPTIPPYPYDPQRARALLAEAGYPDGFAVTYSTTNDEIAKKIALSLQADLAQVGVRVTIQLLTFPAYLTAVGRHELAFAYSAWFMDFPDPWNFLEVKFHSRMISATNSNNDTNYANPEVDRLLDAARAEQDRGKRLALYNRVERILYEDCPWIWHYHARTVEITQPYVKGYRFHPVWLRNYRDTWLDDPRRVIGR